MEFSGKCLCGQVSYKSLAKPLLILNCHCEDCRRSTGAVYGTNVMVPEDQLEIRGEVSKFSHKAKSGNTMTKRFCKTCGTLMFGNSSGRTKLVYIRTGTVDQTDIINPVMTVFVDRKISSTTINDGLPQASEMPQGEPWKKD